MLIAFLHDKSTCSSYWYSVVVCIVSADTTSLMVYMGLLQFQTRVSLSRAHVSTKAQQFPLTIIYRPGSLLWHSMFIWWLNFYLDHTKLYNLIGINSLNTHIKLHVLFPEKLKEMLENISLVFLKNSIHTSLDATSCWQRWIHELLGRRNQPLCLLNVSFLLSI